MKMQNYLTNLLQHLGLEEEECQIDITEAETEINVDLKIPDEDTGLFVGYKAEVINSIQRLLRILFSAEYDDRRITLNINNYRQDRLEQLRERLRGICERLQDVDQEYCFPYLSSYERFNIHSIVSGEEEFAEFESFSEGEGAGRRLVLRKKSESTEPVADQEVDDEVQEEVAEIDDSNQE